MADKNVIDNEEITIESEEVVNKYKMAADVSNRTCFIYSIIHILGLWISLLLEYYREINENTR